MTADVLREAARLMRERAQALPSEARWELEPNGPFARIFPADSDSAVATMPTDHADYFASWHPVVALAVADWLDKEAQWADIGAANSPDDEALTVARAYLGGAS